MLDYIILNMINMRVTKTRNAEIIFLYHATFSGCVQPTAMTTILFSDT